MSERKQKSRKLIRVGTSKTALLKSDLRVSAAGAEAMTDYLNKFLRNYGSAVAKIMSLVKRKTVRHEHLVEASGKVCPAVCHSWINASPDPSYAKASVVRAFKRGLGGDYQISEDAKNDLVGIADSIMKNTRATATNMAGSEKRKTIKERDIQVALGVHAVKKNKGGSAFSYKK